MNPDDLSPESRAAVLEWLAWLPVEDRERASMALDRLIADDPLWITRENWADRVLPTQERRTEIEADTCARLAAHAGPFIAKNAVITMYTHPDPLTSRDRGPFYGPVALAPGEVWEGGWSGTIELTATKPWQVRRLFRKLAGLPRDRSARKRGNARKRRRGWR